MTIYESQKNKIVLSDVMDYIKTIPEKSIDLIIADPPYFQVYGEFDFVFKNEKEYVEWCKKWLFECKRILKDTGTLILYGSLGKRQITFARIAIMIERLRNVFKTELDYPKKHKGHRNKDKLYVSKGGHSFPDKN